MGKNTMRTLIAALTCPALLGLGACTSIQDYSRYQAPDYRPARTAAKPDQSAAAASAKQASAATDPSPAAAAPSPQDRITTLMDPQSGEISQPGLQPANDLLARMRQGFRLDLDHADRRIDREHDWFARHEDYLLRCMKRAEPYLYHIVTELEARDMPLELALLPIVESAFNPYAYSRSHASGIWQFIGSTGRAYGLKQDEWYDGRRDVLAASRAAMDYLQALEERFDGDWLLALAAYNSGERRVERVAAGNRRRGQPADFWHLDLPRETEAYVPKLLAVARLFAESRDWHPQIPNQPYFAVVDHDSQVAIQDVARLAGISMEEMYHLNPGYSRWATPPAGPHHFLVPKDRAEPVLAGLANLPKRNPVSELSHRVRSGDTLSEIAARYETNVASLRRLNGIRGSTIRVGQQLLVDAQQPALADGTLVARNNPHVRNRSRTRRSRTTYTVRRGDNLWSIARRYRVGVRELAAWNGIGVRSTLRPGKKLQIRRVSTRTASTLAGNGKQRRLNYTVRGGDSLWTIARAHRISVSDIRRWNTIGGSFLKPGQILTLFLSH